MQTKTVTVQTVNQGNNFATVAVIRDAKTNRKLAVTDERPFGNDAAALSDAEALAEKKGWRVVAADAD